MDKKNKQFIEIEDLKKAYKFASKNVIDFDNILLAHGLMSKKIIEDKKYRGKIRDKGVYIFSKGIKIYTGAEPVIINLEMLKLLKDIKLLIKSELSLDEIFYYASMIHLIMVHIHPFADCNGRMSRLLEKWFLAEKIGSKARFIQSEKYYQKKIKIYYKSLDIGKSYDTMQIEKSLVFLVMLPMSLRLE